VPTDAPRLFRCKHSGSFIQKTHGSTKEGNGGMGNPAQARPWWQQWVQLADFSKMATWLSSLPLAHIAIQK